jgi:hypothetical protein
METLTCQKCGEFIADVYGGYHSEILINKNQQDLYAVRLPVEGTFYRFFCTKCGEPNTWGIPRDNSVENNSIRKGESIDYSAFRPFKEGWPFATVPPIDSLVAILALAPADSGIHQCAEAFKSNIARIHAVADFTTLVAGLLRHSTASNLMLSQTKIMERARSGNDPGVDLISPNMDDFLKLYLERAELSRSPLSAELLNRIKVGGTSSVITWGGFHPEIGEGIHAIMLSQITMAWTAFEILSKDLWIVALNERPKPLAVNFANAQKGNGPGKSIAFTEMTKFGEYDFNLSKSMGTLFIDQKKADFTSLASTQTAYKDAFGRPLNSLKAPDLHLLALVRNLIVHRGNIVDEQFKEDLAAAQLGSHPNCSDLQEGSPFLITPELASKLVAASVNAGLAILQRAFT